MKKARIALPMHSHGSLNIEALLQLPVEQQRELLDALNRSLGPWIYEELAAAEAAHRARLSAMPIERQEAERLAFERDIVAPRYAQSMLSTEFQLRGLKAGRTKGAGAKKESGAETAEKVSQLVRKLGKPPTARGLAGKIASQLNVDRSTVARHLKALAK